MPFFPLAPPQPVPIVSGFDYLTVDAQRRRVYAAHSGSKTLLIVDADSAKVLGQVRVGGVRGLALDPQSGHVFTGDGDNRTVSEVDPVTLKVVNSTEIDGSADAIAYDGAMHRIYADENNGTHVYVVDSQTFKQVAIIDLPGTKPEYLAIDPRTHDLYQNIDSSAEIAVIDGTTMKVRQRIATPELEHNHPLQLDSGLGHLLVAGTNGVLSIYNLQGKLLHKLAVPKGIDQCDLDPTRHRLACASREGVFLLKDNGPAAPALIAQQSIAPGVHTVAIDAKTGNVWVVWTSAQGDFVQGFSTGS